jgi:hypothetical protein
MCDNITIMQFARSFALSFVSVNRLQMLLEACAESAFITDCSLPDQVSSLASCKTHAACCISVFAVQCAAEASDA